MLLLALCSASSIKRANDIGAFGFAYFIRLRFKDARYGTILFNFVAASQPRMVVVEHQASIAPIAVGADGDPTTKS